MPSYRSNAFPLIASAALAGFGERTSAGEADKATEHRPAPPVPALGPPLVDPCEYVTEWQQPDDLRPTLPRFHSLAVLSTGRRAEGR